MLIAAVTALLGGGGCALANDTEVEEFAIYFDVGLDSNGTPSPVTASPERRRSVVKVSEPSSVALFVSSLAVGTAIGLRRARAAHR